MGKCFIRQTRHARPDLGGRSRLAVNSQGVQWRPFTGRHLVGGKGCGCLGRSTKVFQHRHFACLETSCRQSSANLCYGRFIFGENKQPGVWLNEDLEVGGGPSMNGEAVTIRYRPAHPRGSKREGGEVWNDRHFLFRNEGQDLAGRAIVHRIAGGEHHRMPAAHWRYLVDDRREGLWPFMLLGF
jgi:hypothetical protein